MATRNRYQVAAYEEQVTYQHELDRIFPFGGLCAGLYGDGDRLRPTTVEVLTGRLLCAKAQLGTGDVWWHLLLLDPRKTVEAETDPLKVLITRLVPHAEVPDLWEAPILAPSSGRLEWLRVHAKPPSPWRPTRGMWSAVTLKHLESVFPNGLAP